MNLWDPKAMSSYAAIAATSNRPTAAQPQSTIPTLDGQEANEKTTSSKPQSARDYAAALAQPVSFYEKKTHQIYDAMQGIYSVQHTFEQTAEYYGYTAEELGIAFAVFGVQVMEIVHQRSVVSNSSNSL